MNITLYNGDDESCRAIISEFIQKKSFCLSGYKQMSQEGNDLTIIDELIEILDKNNAYNKYPILKLHAFSALHYKYYYLDARYWSEEDIKERIGFILDLEHSLGKKTDAFYCGITNDLDIRMQQHQEEDFTIVNNKVYAWICPTAQIAVEIENWADKSVGFDIGKTHNKGNDGKDDSVIVYLLKQSNLVAKE